MNAKHLELRVNSINSIFEQTKITSSQVAYDYIRQFYFDDIYIFESFFLLMLNQSNKVIAYAKVSQGGVVGTVVDVRIILKYAIDSLATGIILAHNHPSGNNQPSESDALITRKISEAAEIMDIKVLDHIIVCDEEYYSLKDNGKF